MATINFVVSGNRIATESFAIGKIYEIIFTDGSFLICACNHVGNNFVVFQRELPELLFTLNMETASSVRSIEETGGGGGTYNYNDLENKPQINSVELSGNKSSSDLGLQSALDTSQLDAINSGITAAKVTSFEAKQDAITSNSKLSADLVNDTATANKFVTTAEKATWNAKQNALTASQLDAVNSGITAAKVTAFEGKQDAITSNSKLSADLVDDATTTNKFVTAADKTAWNAKQNALTASQLNAVNSGITAAKVTAFEGKQDAITSSSKLSADLVSDTTTTNKFVTAADKTAWNAKQNTIDSLHMLDADLVNDTTATHKFATAAQLSQITTNKNNISTDEAALVELVDGGAKNLLNLVTPTTINKTTITDVGNGSVTASCSNVTWASSGYKFSLTAGKAYKFIIYVDSASVSDVFFQCFVNDISESTAQEIGRTSRITSTGVYSVDFVATSKIRVSINLNNSGTAATGSATYHAMLCTKAEWDISQTYQPYRPSYQELYEMVKALQAQLAQ